MQGMLYAFLGTLFTFGVTSLGAFNVFFVREKKSHTAESLALGFAGGIMIAASVWSLLIPGMERADALGQRSWLIVSAGFLAGVALLLAADRWILGRRFLEQSSCERGQTPVGKKSIAMLVLAITAHNIPEGMAVGLAFALAAANPGDEALISGAVALTVGIGIQNYPEGAAVALPLLREGMPRGKAFLIGSMSAVVEPLFGVLAAALAGSMLRMMPLLLAMAAGAMVYVVVQELIPEAHMENGDKSGTLGFIAGFIVMMILDIALG